MPREQFNPSTQRVLFNPDTKKVLMVGAICDECEEMGFETPSSIKVITAGILSCEGVNCCPGTQQRKANTSQGDGWGREYILNQGLVGWSNGVPYWQATPPSYPCWWGCIHHGDYGGYDYYNLGECKGGVAEHINYVVCTVTVLVTGQKMIQIQVWLGCDPPIAGYAPAQIFFGIDDINPEGDNCFNYGDIYNNTHKCTGSDDECEGEGTAIILPWPPP